jgi:lysophospholipase L1-like esterase
VEPALEYANVTGRPSSRLVRVAATVSRGVATVQRQHAPYAASWHAANLAALTRPGPRWIVLGDSMSQGAGASSFDAGWVNQLHDRLPVDLPIINLSASGARVPDVIGQQLPAWRSLPPAPGEQDVPDLVTVLIGSNDLMSRTHRDGLSEAFAELVDNLPSGAVVATMPQPRAAATDVNTALHAAEQDGEVVLVNMRSSGPASWRGKLAADHFHPNDAGYTGIADAFYAPVMQQLGRNLLPD